MGNAAMSTARAARYPACSRLTGLYRYSEKDQGQTTHAVSLPGYSDSDGRPFDKSLRRPAADVS